MQNILESDDFGLIAMTESINTLPTVPNRIGSMNLFAEEGIPTTSVGMEMLAGQLNVIPTSERGVFSQAAEQTKRSLLAVSVPHIAKNDTVMADSLQNVRALGSDDQAESYAAVLNSRMEKLKAEHELTWEWHRIGAIQGKILDADGTSEVLDFFTLFNVARIVINWDQTEAQGLKAACMAARKLTATEARGNPFTVLHCMCGEAFWDDLVMQAETRDAYNRFQENSWGRNQTFQSFMYAGVMFEPLFGQIGSTPFVNDDEAASFPNAPIFKRFNAPAPFEETVNTLGKPLYAKQEPLRFGVGTELLTNSNPLHICRFPRTLIQWTKSA